MPITLTSYLWGNFNAFAFADVVTNKDDEGGMIIEYKFTTVGSYSDLFFYSLARH